ncbi:MAG: class I SAM-dependent methyltransferase [Verrucomicrobiota bacterium]
MMISKKETDTLNHGCYLGKEVAERWARKQYVMAEEKAFLGDFGRDIQGAKILDIGIGGGRSTRFLLPLASEYVGIDYSPDMVDAAAASFPGTRIEVGDARNLSAFQDGEFDFVMFSFNGIDCLAHEGRMQTLNEVFRVLKPGGLLGFSSHNRQQPVAKPYSLKYLYRSKHPVRMWRFFLLYLEGIRAWKKSAGSAMACEEYELRHDSGNTFTAPHYYISKPSLVAQVEPLGFDLLAIYDTAGKKVTAEERDETSSWFHYAFRKHS